MASPSLVTNTQVISLLSKRRFLVSWNENPELNIVSYNVYRSENQFDGFTLVGSVGLPSVQLVDTVPFTFGVNYFWKVQAVNSLAQTSDLVSTEAVSDISIGQFDEEPFKQTQVQSADFVINEIPGGLLNNSNLVYTTAQIFRAGTLQVFLNGVLQAPTVNYNENLNQQGFTMITPTPISADTLAVAYIKFSAGI